MNLYRKLRNFLWRLSIKGFVLGPRLSRYYAYGILRGIGNTLPVKRGRVLSISHSNKLIVVLKISPNEVVEANYPEYDILNLNFPDESFDFVLSDQVLEHVDGNPFQAVNECYRVLRPGGIAVHTSSVLIGVHKANGGGDFWRFTPEGFSTLHKNWSKIINTGSWGSLKAFSLMGLDYIRYLPVPINKWHPLNRLAVKNDPNYPITVWIVARK